MPFCAYCGREISALATACPQCGHPNESRAPAVVARDRRDVRSASGQLLARWGKRALAAILDAIVVGMITAVMRALAGITVRPFLFTHADGSITIAWSAFAHGFLLSVGLGWLVSAAYRVPFEGSHGQTLGKMAMRIRLVDRATSAPIGYARAFVRLLAYDLFSVLFGLGLLLDLLWPMWDPERQTLHDKVAGSIVIDEGAPPQPR